MREEIAGVRNALQDYIDLVDLTVPAGEDPPTIQLLTFKDSVSTRITSNDLDAVRSSVGALFASGGGDCPEFSAQALQVAAGNIAPGGTILLATDASSQPGVDIGAVIANLRAKGVTVNTILSGDCTGISSPSKAASAAPGEDPANQLAPSGPQGEDGSGEKPGDDDPPQDPIPDPGQPPADEHGDTPETATLIQVEADPVRGLVGLDPDATDFFTFHLEAGTTYSIRFLLEGGSFVTFRLFDLDGTTLLQARNQFSTTVPGQILFVPGTSGSYFLSAGRGTSGTPTAYVVSVADDPFALLTTAVQMFSTVSAQTGGALFVRDDVNFGRTTEYEAALFNVMASTLGPAVLSSNPDDLPQGSTLAISLTGRNTNWRDGSTVSFPANQIDVLGVDVLSATSLTALVMPQAGATLGFRDVVVETPLGAATEVAAGSNVVEIVGPLTIPSILSVEPSTVSQGQSFTTTVRGALTAWDATSTLTLGPGLSVDATRVMSPELIEADVTVDPAASIGFRTVRVATTGVGTQSKSRALFVNSGAMTLPEIVSLAPPLGGQGETLDVAVEGLNTSFEDGVTTASFGSSIDVLSVSVADATNAVVRVSIDPAAALGFRDVSLTTGAEVAVLLAGFFVSEAVVTALALPGNGHFEGCLEPGGSLSWTFDAAAGSRIQMLEVKGSRGVPGAASLGTLVPRAILTNPAGDETIFEAVSTKKNGLQLKVKNILVPLDGQYFVTVEGIGAAGGCFKGKVHVRPRK
jgi:hypothetical protein